MLTKTHSGEVRSLTCSLVDERDTVSRSQDQLDPAYRDDEDECVNFKKIQDIGVRSLPINDTWK